MDFTCMYVWVAALQRDRHHPSDALSRFQRSGVNKCAGGGTESVIVMASSMVKVPAPAIDWSSNVRGPNHLISGPDGRRHRGEVLGGVVIIVSQSCVLLLNDTALHHNFDNYVPAVLCVGSLGEVYLMYVRWMEAQVNSTCGQLRRGLLNMRLLDGRGSVIGETKVGCLGEVYLTHRRGLHFNNRPSPQIWWAIDLVVIRRSASVHNTLIEDSFLQTTYP